tara:strand:+ start:81 stop:1112 length:1032 start_codon:yes stop_codon:yes gene_type:complete
MPFQKVEFSFPDEEGETLDVEVEDSGAVEIDISGKKNADDYADTSVESETSDTKQEEELDIEVVDDTPKADRNRKPSEPPSEVTDEELESYSEKVRQRIKHFSKGYHDERRAKESAQRERQELERVAQNLVEENKELKGNVNKNQTALLEQAKKSATSELDEAKRLYKDAYEAGDADRVVDAQESITNAKIKADKLNNFKLPALQEEETPVQNNQEYVEPTVQLDERAEKWALDNTWFQQDDEMTAYAIGLHQKLVKTGVNPQSDEYYETIDARMRKLFPEEFEDLTVEEPKSKRQSNVVAPATRSTAPKKVTLTQTQVAIAKKLGVPLEEYAKQVAIEMRNR